MSCGAFTHTWCLNPHPVRKVLLLLAPASRRVDGDGCYEEANGRAMWQPAAYETYRRGCVQGEIWRSRACSPQSANYGDIQRPAMYTEYLHGDTVPTSLAGAMGEDQVAECMESRSYIEPAPDLPFYLIRALLRRGRVDSPIRRGSAEFKI
jgi:hypothetical protein